MSGLKILQAVIPDARTGLATLETAFLLGRLQGSHVRVLHVRPDPATSIPLIGEAMSGALVDEVMRLTETQGKEREAEVTALFNQAVGRFDLPVTDEPPGPGSLSVSLQVVVGAEDDVAALQGRMSDLIVVGRPSTDEEPALQATLNAVLLDSGRPVLVAPPRPVNTLGTHVAIAWNGSPEAMRAIAAAQPLLLKAEKVTILVAEEGDSLTSAADLETYLAWHGVSAAVQPVKAAGLGGAAIGSALLTSCGAIAADLLVMGAFTHSRLRQLILGGVTRHVLDHATLPVLFSH